MPRQSVRKLQSMPVHTLVAMNIIQKIRQVIGEIRENKDPMKLQGNWELVERLISRVPVDQARASQACREKDVEMLDNLMADLEAASAPVASKPEHIEVTHEMREALRAFRKRLKLVRLDDESRLGNRQLTGGSKSEIDAIIPPAEYPSDVWDSLVAAGLLKDTGQGFYMLP